MELIKHSNYIWEYKNVVPIDVCKKMVSKSEEMFSLVDKSQIFPRNPVRNNTGICMTKNANKHLVIYELDQLSHQYISIAHQKYINENKLISLALGQSRREVQLTSTYTYRKYNKNDDYQWHVDTHPKFSFVLSYIIYLNDDYTGGNTMFLNERIKVKGSLGSILCFPCGFNMLHKSSKIKSGEKHIVWTCMAQ